MTGARGRLMQASTHPHHHEVAANRYCPVVVKTGKVRPLRSLVAPRGTVAEVPAPCCSWPLPGRACAAISATACGTAHRPPFHNLSFCESVHAAITAREMQ